MVKYKNSKEYKNWAKEVKKRDGWECVVCGATKLINAHHIIPCEIKEFRNNVTNGISLCSLHHRFSRELSAHQNPLAFFKWLKIWRYRQFEYLWNMTSIDRG